MENKSESTSGATAQSGCFVCQTARPFLEHIWNDATRSHFRNSRIEFLKGIRSLIDDRIARLSRDEPKGTHVPVE
ncbi:MAG TPA: hypothetical protein VMB03_06850 [Bryobacteraceae bacterium]|nr:hypothetical protein [Bryobacteraceae bacterium]